MRGFNEIDFEGHRRNYADQNWHQCRSKEAILGTTITI